MSEIYTERFKKTICVDFDGVIHSYKTKFSKPEIISDEPVPGMIEWLDKATERFDVTIQSTRANTCEGRNAIRDWLVLHGFDNEKIILLTITDQKPMAIVYIDDRGWRFDGKVPNLDEIDKFKPWNK